MISLPFGSKAAVNAFIRCARPIQWFAAKCLMVPATCHFDDFSFISKTDLSNSSEACMSLLLKIMGRACETTGPKADDFFQEIAALGVLFKLDETYKGELTMDNTPKRRSKLSHLIRGILGGGKLSKKETESLSGRLAFAYSQVFGRAGQLALQQISLHACAVPFKLMNEALRDALDFLQREYHLVFEEFQQHLTCVPSH